MMTRSTVNTHEDQHRSRSPGERWQERKCPGAHKNECQRCVQAKAITSLYIHAKMALADYNTTGQVVYPGSENFSNVSLDQNRELGILVNEKPILDRLESVFSQDWQVPAMKET